MTERMTPKRRKALADAAREAEGLEAGWKESVRHHELRVEAQFEELRRRLRAKARGRQPKGLPSAGDAEHILAVLAQVRVKAGKGRAKDLRRVEDALRAALDRLPSE